MIFHFHHHLRRMLTFSQQFMKNSSRYGKFPLRFPAFCAGVGFVTFVGVDTSRCFYSSDLAQTPSCVEPEKKGIKGKTGKPVLGEKERKWLEQHKKNVACLEVEKGYTPLRLLVTRLRDKETKTEDFVRYTNRLARFVAEIVYSRLGELHDVTLETPSGLNFRGSCLSSDLNRTTIVSVLRSGDAMLPAFVQVNPSVSTGKLLITRYANHNVRTKEPILYYSNLPKSINNGPVVLIDPMLSSGETMKVALRELVEENKMKENQILVVCIIACVEGIQNVLKSYPSIRLITVALDDGSAGYLRPGLGSFGDRYFGSSRR